MAVGSSEVHLEDLTILILSTMIKKKNYKEQDHFSNFQSVSVCAPGGKKFVIYFKRHRSSKVGGSSLYDLMHSKKGKQSSQAQTTNTSESNYSEDRTLELISFDGSLGFFKQYLRKLGKIRKYETGEGTYDGNTLHYSLCVFKFEFDLVKCFREDYFENMMEEASKSVEHSEDKEEERYNIIKQYMVCISLTAGGRAEREGREAAANARRWWSQKNPTRKMVALMAKYPQKRINTNIAITREWSSKYTQHAFTISSGHPICKCTEHSKVVCWALSFHCIRFCPPPRSSRKYNIHLIIKKIHVFQIIQISFCIYIIMSQESESQEQVPLEKLTNNFLSKLQRGEFLLDQISVEDFWSFRYGLARLYPQKKQIIQLFKQMTVHKMQAERKKELKRQKAEKREKRQKTEKTEKREKEQMVASSHKNKQSPTQQSQKTDRKWVFWECLMFLGDSFFQKKQQSPKKQDNKLSIQSSEQQDSPRSLLPLKSGKEKKNE